MFGYVRPCNSRLTADEKKQYRKLYCLLCDTIGKRYGFIYRFVLSFDVTFLLLCLESLSSSGEVYTFRCPAKPYRKIAIDVDGKNSSYAAFINVYMVYRKAVDNQNDAHGLLSRFFWKNIAKSIRKNKKVNTDFELHSDFVARANNHFERLAEMENDASNYFADELFDEFGKIMQCIISFAPIEQTDIAQSLELLYYNLGKWLYIVDAVDDYLIDKKSNSFNAVDRLKIPPVSENTKIEAARLKKAALLNKLLVQSMTEANKTINGRYDAIIGNIVSIGCAKKFREVSERLAQAINIESSK